MKELGDYKQWLLSEFSRRRDQNPGYSLRSFSYKLGISPGALSQIISGKRPLTLKTARRIAVQLDLNPSEAEVLFESVQMAMRDRKKIIVLKSPGEEQMRLLTEWLKTLDSEFSQLLHIGHDADQIRARIQVLRERNLVHMKLLESGQIRSV